MNVKGKKFVVTGTLEDIKRDDFKKLLKLNGATLVGDVSGRTDYLIVGEKPGKSKLIKAEECGIPVIDENDFYRMFDIELDFALEKEA